jgi:hypothetical protein
MARRYARDSRGRFSSGGGAAGRRTLRAKVGTSVTAPRLRRNAVSGTAKPRGTISGTRFGRSVDQFSRETAAMMGRAIKPKVARVSPTLKQQAKAAGLRTVNPRTTSRRVLRDNTFLTSAPRGTIPKRNPSAAITSKDGPRKLIGTTGTGRTGRYSGASALIREQARSSKPAARIKRLPRQRSTIRKP